MVRTHSQLEVSWQGMQESPCGTKAAVIAYDLEKGWEASSLKVARHEPWSFLLVAGRLNTFISLNHMDSTTHDSTSFASIV